MVDKITPEARSRNMRSISAKNTGPELIVRDMLKSKRFKFELHSKELPGSPDIVLSRHSLAIFVHGCFWHRHSGCHLTSSPKSNVLRWEKKFAANTLRDRNTIEKLKQRGWRTLVVWECALKNEFERSSLPDALRKAILSGKVKMQIPRVASRRRSPRPIRKR
jgi:DNA mismatch endonuclease, patch repair protein